MNTFKVKTDSWHYRFHRSKFGGTKSKYEIEDMNFCQYWRSLVIDALFSIAAIICVLGIITVLGFIPLLDIYGMELSLSIVPLAFIIGLIFLILPVMLIIGSVLLVNFLHDKRSMRIANKNNEDYEPGLLMTKYLSWKEKYCPAIEIKNE